MAATVELALVLLDRASGPLRNIRREAERTDRALAGVGDSMDSAFDNRRLRSLEMAERDMSNIGTTSRRTSRDVDVFDRRSNTLAGSLIKLGGVMRGLRSAFGLLKIPALIAGFGALVQVVGSLSAGVVSLLPRLSDMAGLLATGAQGMVTLGLAAVTTRLAFKDLHQAYLGSSTALKRLTPQGREFLKVLKGYKPVFDSFRSAAQKGLFPGLEEALKTARRGVPTLRRGIRGTGEALGGAAANLAEQFTTPSALRDFNKIFAESDRIIHSAGTALGNFGRAIMQVMVAARPLTEWVRRTIVDWSQMALQAARAGRQTGTLSDYFRHTRRAVSDLLSIFGDLWGVMRDVSAAARPLGEHMWSGWVDGAERLHELTSSPQGMSTMRHWFDSMRAPLHELWALTKAIGEALAHLSTGREATQMLRSLRGLVPALEQLISSVTAAFGPTLVDTITHLASAFEAMKVALGEWGRLLNTVVRALDWLLTNVPGLTNIVGGLFAAFTFYKIFGPMGKLTTMWRSLSATIAGATVQTERFAAAEAGAAGVPVRGAAATSVAQSPFGAATTVAGGAAAGGLLSRVGGLAGGAARAAARYVLPVSALFAATDFISTPGSLTDKATGAVSGATFGLIPPPLTDQQRRQQRRATQQEAVQHLPGGAMTPGGVRMQIAALRGRRQYLREHPNMTAPGGATFEGQTIFPGGGALDPSQQTQWDALTKKIGKLRGTVQDLVDTMKNARVDKFSSQFQDAFEFRTRRGQTPAEAFKAETDDILKRAARLGPEAGGKLASNYMRWARQMAHDNPKLENVVDDLGKQIEDRFSKIGDHVEVTNGKVLTGSTEQWKKIKTAIGGPAWEAEREVGGAFGQLEQQAFAALKAMGYSPDEIRNLFQAGAGATRRAGNLGGTAGPQAGIGRNVVQGGRGSFAIGGRIPGQGLYDSVPLSDVAAPGELVINRHTENRIDRELGRRGALADAVTHEHRQHFASLPTGEKMARGGRTSVTAATHGAGGGGLVPGHPELHTGISQATEAVLQKFPGLAITSTTGGSHVSGSYHYLGEAADISGASDLMLRASDWIKSSGLYRSLQEGIHNPNLSVAGGHMVPSSYYSAVWAGHADHIHMAVTEAAIGAFRAGAAAAGGAAAQAIHLKGLRSALAGVPGALSQRAMDAIKAGMERKINARTGARGGASAGRVPGNLSRYDHVYAEHMAPDFGGETLPFNTVASIAEWAGLPGITFAQIAKGESGLRPGSAGTDPGGTQGFGLWAITTGVGNDAMIQQLGGPHAMLNPLINARAAKMIYDSSGIGAWYGTSFLTDPNAHYQGRMPKGPGAARGGRVDWGGWHAAGGTFLVDSPTVFGAGEGGKREQVTIGSPGAGHTHIHVHIGKIENHREGDIEAELESALRRVAERLSNGATLDADDAMTSA